MLPVLTAAQMRDADRRTIEEVGLPGAVLMENAGGAVARLVQDRFGRDRRVAVLCGKGNNGGDGFVAARLLAPRAQVYLFALRGDVKGDARLHLGVLERSGGRVREVPDVAAWEQVRGEVVGGADVVVDALLGTGLREAPTGLLARVIEDVAAGGGRLPVVAVDLPSGLGSDSGEVPWPTLSAAATVTFAAPKYGHVFPPACDRVGDLIVADIGIPPDVMAGVGPSLWLLEAADAAGAYPRRQPGSHKGTFGHVLVVGGSVGKAGAAVLAATGALAAGAGLVTVATPAPALPMVAAGRPEVMTEALPATASGAADRQGVDRAVALAKARDAVVLGPGLGQEAATRDFVRELVRRCPVPLLVDADGLNALASDPRSAAAVDALRRPAPTVVTPHPGEMARLTGSSAGEVQRRRLETGRSFAMQTGATVVLKGQRTVVADPSGRAAVNPTGNPGMATGGTGDVLAGIVGALLARGLDAWTAAVAGVWVHGSAGDLAAAVKGQESMLAGDLVAAVPDAIRRLGASVEGAKK